MKPKLLALASLPPTLLVAIVAVVAPRPHTDAPEVVAEPWSPPAVVPTATAEETSPAPAPETRPTPREEVKARAGSLARDYTPRILQSSPRRCPPSIKSPEPYLREGRCPPPTRGDTPLVLSFDGAPIEYLADRAHAFDLDGAASQVTDWPTARSPWLALDRDGDGRIADGSELFGSMTVLASGARASNGFDALRELDADGDGRLTPADPAFAKLLVWIDRNGDRRSSPDELVPASAYGLVSIDLDYTVSPRCDVHGNCEVERASFRYRDAAGVERTGAVIDVHLAVQR
jgi:hypothetical protein